MNGSLPRGIREALAHHQSVHSGCRRPVDTVSYACLVGNQIYEPLG